MHAERCPICYGEGTLRYIDGIELSGIHLNGEEEKQCHGCNGKGWVEVQNETTLPSETLFVTNDNAQ